MLRATFAGKAVIHNCPHESGLHIFRTRTSITIRGSNRNLAVNLDPFSMMSPCPKQLYLSNVNSIRSAASEQYTTVTNGQTDHATCDTSRKSLHLAVPASMSATKMMTELTISKNILYHNNHTILPRVSLIVRHRARS
jgi:hypothetical protein